MRVLEADKTGSRAYRVAATGWTLRETNALHDAGYGTVAVYTLHKAQGSAADSRLDSEPSHRQMGQDQLLIGDAGARDLSLAVASNCAFPNPTDHPLLYLEHAANDSRPRGWECGGLAQFATDSHGVRGGDGRERLVPPCFASHRWENDYTHSETEATRDLQGKVLVSGIAIGAAACWGFEVAVVSEADPTSAWLQYAGLLLPSCIMLAAIHTKAYRARPEFVSCAIGGLGASVYAAFSIGVADGARADLGYLSLLVLQLYLFFSGSMRSTAWTSTAAVVALLPLLAALNLRSLGILADPSANAVALSDSSSSAAGMADGGGGGAPLRWEILAHALPLMVCGVMATAQWERAKRLSYA